MYTEKNFRSKKELKEAVAAYNAAVAINAQLPEGIEKMTIGCVLANIQRRPVNPVRYFQPGPFGGNEPMNGTFGCEGPHYPEPHRWYATCTAKDGVIIKVR
jgi:hypothetical protein